MKNQNNMSPPKDNSPIVITTNKNDMEKLTKKFLKNDSNYRQTA